MNDLYFSYMVASCPSRRWPREIAAVAAPLGQGALQTPPSVSPPSVRRWWSISTPPAPHEVGGLRAVISGAPSQEGLWRWSSMGRTGWRRHQSPGWVRTTCRCGWLRRRCPPVCHTPPPSRRLRRCAAKQQRGGKAHDCGAVGGVSAEAAVLGGRASWTPARHPTFGQGRPPPQPWAQIAAKGGLHA